MRQLIPILSLAAATLLMCAPQADAQGRRMRTRVVSAPAGTQVIRTSDANSGKLNPTVSTLNSDNSVERVLLGDYPAPGLGFDYTHLGVRNRNLGVRAAIDPATQHRLALERQLRRDAPRGVASAYPVVWNSVVVNVNVVPQPPVVIVQEPEPEPEYGRLERAAYLERLERLERREGLGGERVAVPEREAAPVYEPPLREADELVLIRRDGGLLFAVAFTTRPGAAGDARLVYITREGHRRSDALAELDLDATRDINEARGTSLHLQ
jgi:hypothetical protein